MPAPLRARMDAAADWILKAERVWIGTHVDPDGDAVGSSLDLAQALRARGCAVSLACQDAPPRETRFLPGVEGFSSLPPDGSTLRIALDTGDRERLGTLYRADSWEQGPSILLDHHASNPGFCDIDIIDPGAASTAELVLELLAFMDVQPDAQAATCLLTGIVTDTIGFRTSNTRARSLRAATRLVEAGADLSFISQEVFYRQPLSGLKLAARAIERLDMRQGLGITWILQADYAECGARADDGREISRMLASIDELRALGILRQREDGRFDLSMRARPGVNLIPAAESMGGGGHPQAAGARLDGTLEEARSRVRGALERVVGAGSAEAS